MLFPRTILPMRILLLALTAALAAPALPLLLAADPAGGLPLDSLNVDELAKQLGAQTDPAAGKKPSAAPAVPAPTGEPRIPPGVLPKPGATPAAAGLDKYQALMAGIWVFALAVFVGFEVIAKVPPTLHTPLMSGSNAISGITIVGAIILAGSTVTARLGTDTDIWRVLGTLAGLVAIALAMTNIVGGFLVTHRMLGMFQSKQQS